MSNMMHMMHMMHMMNTLNIINMMNTSNIICAISIYVTIHACSIFIYIQYQPRPNATFKIRFVQVGCLTRYFIQYDAQPAKSLLDQILSKSPEITIGLEACSYWRLCRGSLKFRLQTSREIHGYTWAANNIWIYFVNHVIHGAFLPRCSIPGPRFAYLVLGSPYLVLQPK